MSWCNFLKQALIISGNFNAGAAQGLAVLWQNHKDKDHSVVYRGHDLISYVQRREAYLCEERVYKEK